MLLKQADYEHLISLKKRFKNNIIIKSEPAPLHWTREIISMDSEHTFLLDFYRGSFNINRFTINTRFKKNIVLIRFDSQGKHTNPDETSFDGPHVHIYKEGYSDKFAYPVSLLGLQEANFTIREALSKLLDYFNVIEIPKIQ